MDLETETFLNDCLNRAAVMIHEDHNDLVKSLKIQRELDQIRSNTAAALETLENGQRQAYNELRYQRYR